MKLVSWNVNGIRSVRQKGFDSFVAEQNPDLLCLQEIKIDAEKFDSVEMVPPEYVGHCSHAEKKGYSGVATYLKNDIDHNEADLELGLTDGSSDVEGRCLISSHRDFTLYNLYIPSGTTGDERQQVKYQYLNQLLDHLQSLPTRERNKLVLCGDFNICHSEIDIHHPDTATKRELSGFLPEERKWMDRFIEAGFVDTFRHIHGDICDRYSWWSFRAGSRKKNLGWRIDYFFVSHQLAEKIVDADILDQTTGSDHCPVTLELDF